MEISKSSRPIRGKVPGDGGFVNRRHEYSSKSPNSPPSHSASTKPTGGSTHPDMISQAPDDISENEAEYAVDSLGEFDSIEVRLDDEDEDEDDDDDDDDDVEEQPSSLDGDSA
jgi:hypothetical protein